MPPAASYARVLAAITRLSPPWPSTLATSRNGKELDVIAQVVARVVDRVDAFVGDDYYPDTTTSLLTRWESICRTASIFTKATADRHERILSVLRRVAGPKPDQIRTVLAPILDCAEDDLVILETLREFIEDELTQVSTATFSLSASPISLVLGKPWPGKVDDTGVRLYLRQTALGTPTVTLKSPSGTTWAVSVTAAEGWYENRTAFLGEPAGGAWTVSVANGTGGVNLLETRLLVSNDVDSGAIYCTTTVRVATGGEPDVPEAQRVLSRMALTHMDARVAEALELVCDVGICDREPVAG